jgi:hypothetical protein
MARRFGYFHLVAAVIVGVGLGVGLVKLVPHLKLKKSEGPWEDWIPVSKIENQMNECLIKEMRGQPDSMIATVYAVCAKRSGIR